MFSKIYNEHEQNPEYLEVAKLGAEFLEKYGKDEEGNFYFSLDKNGVPIIMPYNIFSDCFAAVGFY